MKIYQNIIISFRRFQSEKVNSLISLLGLVLALGIVTVILIFIFNELNYNSFFQNKSEVYRVLNYDEAESQHWATTPYQICELAKEELSEVEDATYLRNINNASFYKDLNFIEEDDVIGAKSSFFNVFGIKILQGKLDGFDFDKHKILISTKSAYKYFENENPVGKSLKMKLNNLDYHMQIAAVFEDIPNNTTIRADFIVNTEIAFEDLEKNIITGGNNADDKSLKEAWLNVSFTNYLLVKKSAPLSLLEKKIKNFGKQHSPTNEELNLSIQSLENIYFHYENIIDNNRKEMGNLKAIYILGIIGFLLLIIAFINYLNLALAQAITRLKSFAVKRSYGASQIDILKQLIFDYCLLAVLALPLSILFAKLCLPFASDTFMKPYNLEINDDFISGFIILISLTLLTGVMTALATFMKFKNSQLVVLLKGVKAGKNQYFPLQKAMIVFQILIFIILLSCTIAIQKQVNYAFGKDLGFAKEEIVSIPIGDHNKELLKQKLLEIPTVKSVSSAMWLPPTNNEMTITIKRVDRTDENAFVNGLFVDYDFIETMGIKILKGDDFQEGKHQSGVIVNQSAAKVLGLQQIIGEETSFGTVRALIDDFHLFPIKKEIPPTLLCLSPSSVKHLIVRIHTKNVKNTINKIEEVWSSTNGNSVFEFEFIDDALNRLYQSEIQFSRLIAILAFIAILIASLGLLQLSLFIGKQKTKEIGIRKSNGAKTYEIVKMLNQDFFKLVIVAFVLACPVAYYVMNQWLQNFAYKTNLSWWIFALAGIIAMGIALLTVSWQSWRAAKRNPVESLRYE